MHTTIFLALCLAALCQGQALCPDKKTVGTICYTRVETSVDTSQYGCQEPCLYTSQEGGTFCFKTGDLNVTESCSYLDSTRHAWTCQHCKATGSALANMLTTDEALAGTGHLLVPALCPLSDNTEECEASLPGFWAAMARIIFPQFGEQHLCDMDTCAHGEAEVSLGSSLCVTWVHAPRGRQR